MKHTVVKSSPYLVACLLLVGCGKSEEADLPSPAPAPAAAQASVELGAAPAAAIAPAAPTAAPLAGGNSGAPAAIAGTEVPADAEQALAQLNQILTGVFLAEIGRPPTSVNEFVERGLIRQLPKAPEGKKFFYDAQQNRIVLAARQPGDVDPAPLTAEQAQRAYLQTAAEINKRIGN
ncbi:MAG TPA: hypothetical protein VGH19_18240 [Verrucomicrobiae bacterium]